MNKFQTYWRPAFAWAFIFFFTATGVTLLGLLWLSRIVLSDAAAILITMLAMGAGVTGSYAVGRTYEKTKGVADNEPRGN